MLGFFGTGYSAEYGGAEMDELAVIVLAGELGRSTFSGVTITVLVHTDMASVLVADAGSDVKSIRMTARREGDSYALNGSKLFITNGVHADLRAPRRSRRSGPLGRRGF